MADTTPAKEKAAAKKTPGDKKPATPRKPPRAKLVEEAARRYFDALSARDPDAIVACWHPGGVDDIVPLGVFRGPQEIRSMFTGLFEAFPDLETRVTRVVADRDRAAVEWRMEGTFNGAPFQGIKPTGKRADLRGLDCLEVDEEGRITQNTGYYDGAAFARNIGMLPPQDSAAEKAMTVGFNAVTKLRARVGR